MARTRQSVGFEDRLTIVEHLTELRRRLLIGLAFFALAFVGAWAFNDQVLSIVNDPLRASQAPDCTTQQADPLAQSACFQLSVGRALGALSPALDGLAGDVDQLGAGASSAEREAVQERVQRIERAAAAAARAARAAPESATRNPVTLGVAEPFFQTFTVSAYAAIVVSLPFLLWQLYAFLIPAFSPREKRVAVPLLWAVPFLFYAGVLFAYLAALPRAVDFLQNFNDQNFDILVQAKEYYRFTAIFLGGVGVLFQVPVVVLGISRLGIQSAAQLRRRRGIVTLLMAVLAAIVTPTPDPVTMLIAMSPLVLLFEGSVALAAFFEKRYPVQARFDVDTWGDAASDAGRSLGEAWSDLRDVDEDDEDALPWEDDLDDLDEDDDEPEGPGGGDAAGTGPGAARHDAGEGHDDDGPPAAASGGAVRDDAPPVLPPGVRDDARPEDDR